MKTLRHRTIVAISLACCSTVANSTGSGRETFMLNMMPERAPSPESVQINQNLFLIDFVIMNDEPQDRALIDFGFLPGTIFTYQEAIASKYQDLVLLRAYVPSPTGERGDVLYKKELFQSFVVRSHEKRRFLFLVACMSSTFDPPPTDGSITEDDLVPTGSALDWPTISNFTQRYYAELDSFVAQRLHQITPRIPRPPVIPPPIDRPPIDEI